MASRAPTIKRPGLVLAGLFIVGLSSIVVAWLVVPEGHFLRGLLVEIGGGVLLFAALLLVERDLVASFEASINTAQAENRQAVEEVRERVDQVEDSVAEVRSEISRLGEVGAATKQALAEREAETERAFDAFAEGVSPATIDGILKEGERLDAVSEDGVRVQIPESWLRMRFSRSRMSEFMSAVSGVLHVNVYIEELDGTEVHNIMWSDETASDVMLTVIEKLQARGDYNKEFDADSILSRLRDTVRTAVDLKSKARLGPSDLSPLIELPNDQWAVTTYGVESIERRYAIGKDRLGDTDWSRHMFEKPWVDYDKFTEAFGIAQAIWKRKEQERIEAESAPF